jgi:hypothetical protein
MKFFTQKNPKIEEEIQHLGSSNGFGFFHKLLLFGCG